MREMALGLAARDWSVEVLTTCATDNLTWSNDLRSGTTEEDGIPVHRFETVPNSTYLGSSTHQRIHAGEPTTIDEQVSWLSFPFRVPGLFNHLLRRTEDFDAVLFAPYLFWTTTACLPVVRSRAVLVPCLHDEVWARIEAIRPLLRDPAAVWFLSEPEHRLAHRLGPVAANHRVVGAGVDVPDGYRPEEFKQRYNLSRPFLLYAGRREIDKGWNWLVDTFAHALEEHDAGFDLVTIGTGKVEVPQQLDGRLIDLGFLGRAERDDAFAAACAYLQPSLMESFSRTVMEAWLATTPVLARAGCEVVSWHCERSGGGRTFADGSGLSVLLHWLHQSPDRGSAMGQRGRKYVLENYRWPVVLDRVEFELRHRFLEGLPPAATSRGASEQANHPS